MKRLAAALAFLLAAAPASAAGLKIVSIDVEGGAATLFVTPEGRSLLIDTGWPKGFGQMPSPDGSTESADRIVAAAKRLGVSRIDYVLVTHYHDDHSGGTEALVRKIPVGAFIDHGANGDPLRPDTPPERVINVPAGQYPRYLQASTGHRPDRKPIERGLTWFQRISDPNVVLHRLEQEENRAEAEYDGLMARLTDPTDKRIAEEAKLEEADHAIILRGLAGGTMPTPRSALDTILRREYVVKQGTSLG